MDALYRLNQFWQNVTARPLSRFEHEEIAIVLNQGEMTLFQQMSAGDQGHAYRVYWLLRASGHTDSDLLAAALLHDVGKVHGHLSAWDRSVAVLGETFVPHWVKQWGAGNETGWKRIFVVRRQHAAWGAVLAQDAGSRPGAVDLIRRHQDPIPLAGDPQDESLRLLQWADDQN